MDLETLTRGWEAVRLAGPGENEELLGYLNRTPLPASGIAMRYDRSPDFFRLLRYHSPDSYTFTRYRQHGELTGLATVTARAAYHRGERCRVAHLGDLRSSFDRHALRAWRAWFTQFLREAPSTRELSGVSAFLAPIIDTNVAAHRALVHPKGNYGYRAHRLSSYNMVNILGRLPGTGRRSAPGIHVRLAEERDSQRLAAFIDRENRRKAFGYPFPVSELERRLSEWDDFELGGFTLAEDNAGDLLGCFNVWAPRAAKRIYLTRLPKRLGLLRHIPGANRMINFPKPGGEYVVQYLTHLEINQDKADSERQRIFRAMLDFAVGSPRPRGSHALAFADFPQRPLAPALRGYLTHEVPMALYGFTPSDVSPSHWLPDLDDRTLPGFEMALV